MQQLKILVDGTCYYMQYFDKQKSLGSVLAEFGESIVESEFQEAFEDFAKSCEKLSRLFKREQQ